MSIKRSYCISFELLAVLSEAWVLLKTHHVFYKEIFKLFRPFNWYFFSHGPSATAQDCDNFLGTTITVIMLLLKLNVFLCLFSVNS